MLWLLIKSESSLLHVQRRMFSSIFRERNLLILYRQVPTLFAITVEQRRLHTSTSLSLNELSRNVRQSLSRSSHRLCDTTKHEVNSLTIPITNTNYSDTETSKTYAHLSSQKELEEKPAIAVVIVAATANAHAKEMETIHNTRTKQRVNVNALFELLLRASYELHSRVDSMTNSSNVDAVLQSYTNWLHPLLCIRIIKSLGYVCSTNTGRKSSLCWTHIVQNYAQVHFYALAESAYRRGNLSSSNNITSNNEEVCKVSIEQLRKLDATSLIMEQLVFPLISVLKIHHPDSFTTLNAELADIVPIILQWWAVLPLSTLPAFSVVDWLPYMNNYYKFLSTSSSSELVAGASSFLSSLEMENEVTSDKELSLTFLLECVIAKVLIEQRHSCIAEEEYVKLLTSTFVSFTVIAINKSRLTSTSGNVVNKTKNSYNNNDKEGERMEFREADRLLADVLFWQGSDCTLPYLLEPLVQRAFVLYKQRSMPITTQTSSTTCRNTSSFHTNNKISSIDSYKYKKGINNNNHDDESMSYVKLFVAIYDDDCFRRFLLRLVHIQTNAKELHKTQNLVHIYLEPYLELRTCSTTFQSSEINEKDELQSQTLSEMEYKHSKESVNMSARDISLRILNPLYDYLMTLPLKISTNNNNENKDENREMSTNKLVDKKISIHTSEQHEELNNKISCKNNNNNNNKNKNNYNIQLSFVGVSNILSSAFTTLESLRSQSSCNDKVFRALQTHNKNNENKTTNSCNNNKCDNSEKIYTLLPHKPRVHVLKRICEMLLHHTRWELTSTPGTMTRDKLTLHLDKASKLNEMQRSSLHIGQKYNEIFFCDVGSSQRELVLRQMCGHARALVRVVMEEKHTSLLYDGPEGAALTSGGLHDNNHSCTTHNSLSYKSTVTNTTTIKPYIEILRNAAFRVVEPSLLKYDTLIREMICHNCKWNYCTSERVLVQPYLSFTSLQFIFHDSTDHDATHRAFLLQLDRSDKQMIMFMRGDDALRAQFEMLTHLYRVIGEASALPTARHLLLSSLSSSSSSSPYLHSFVKTGMKNADEIFATDEENVSLTSNLSLLASSSLYLHDNCVVTTLEAFRLFTIYALLFHETAQVEEYLNVKCAIHRFDKVWHLLQQGTRTTLQIKAGQNSVEHLHEVNETDELQCKELYELQQLQKRFLLMSLLLAREMCLAQFEKYDRERKHTDKCTNARSNAKEIMASEINNNDFSLYFTSLINDMPINSTMRSNGEEEELLNNLDTRSRHNNKVNMTRRSLLNGNVYFIFLHQLLDKLSERDEGVLSNNGSKRDFTYLSEWGIVGIDVNALLSDAESHGCVGNASFDNYNINVLLDNADETKNDENKSSNANNDVFVNSKRRSHVYFPPSASLAHHVCAKWELIEELKEYAYMSKINNQEAPRDGNKEEKSKYKEQEEYEETLHESTALPVNKTVPKLTMWEWLGSSAAVHYVVASMQSTMSKGKDKCKTNNSSSSSSSSSSKEEEEICRYFLIPWSTLAKAQEPLRLYDEGNYSKNASQQFMSNLYTLLNSSILTSNSNNTSTCTESDELNKSNGCNVVVRFVSIAEEVAHFHSLTHSPRLLLGSSIVVYNREIDETLSLHTWSKKLVEQAINCYNSSHQINGTTMNKKKCNTVALKNFTDKSYRNNSSDKVKSKSSFDDKVQSEVEEEEDDESDFYFDDDDGLTFDKLD